MAAAAKRASKGAAKAAPEPDYQEEAALERAAAAVARFSPGANNPRSLAAVAISEWIIARTAMAASVRLTADLMFDLGDARLRGFVEAALPAIGGSLSYLPEDKALFELSKADVIGVFVAGIRGAVEAAAAANESLGFPFDDAIPFGGPIQDKECTH